MNSASGYRVGMNIISSLREPPYPAPSTDGLVKALSVSTFPGYWGPMVRFESDSPKGEKTVRRAEAR
jgi:hypothetical protein